jgi:hypothetical protein
MSPMLQAAVLGLLCCATALAGCGGDTGHPTSPSAVPATSPQLKVTGVHQRVTGVAFIRLLNDPNISDERFTFSAVRHQDGHVSGRFELFSEQNVGVRFHGIITCLAIDGPTARLGGIITKSLDPNSFVGEPVIWTVVDRGEGGAAPPDLVTDFLSPLFSHEVEEFCAGTFDSGLPLQPIDRGNIQVQP